MRLTIVPFPWRTLHLHLAETVLCLNHVLCTLARLLHLFSVDPSVQNRCILKSLFVVFCEGICQFFALSVHQICKPQPKVAILDYIHFSQLVSVNTCAQRPLKGFKGAVSQDFLGLFFFHEINILQIISFRRDIRQIKNSALHVLYIAAKIICV